MVLTSRWRDLCLIIGIVLCISGCTDTFLGSETADTPAENFDLVWSDIDRHYAHFSVKDVDWKKLYGEYRPRVVSGMTDDALYELLCDLMEQLQDGHVNLQRDGKSCGYTGWFENYPRNFLREVIQNRYLKNRSSTTGGGRIVYGRLDGNLGYIHVNSFSGNGWADDIDVALAGLDGISGLVLDVRDNGGGSGASARSVAARFADSERIYAYYSYRNGPDYDDMTAPEPLTVEPAGKQRFSGPVAVLTNRSCFSACESFVMAMQTFHTVTVIGDTTGGGLGNPLWRELPNGWSYRFPIWIQKTPEGKDIENDGIVPDIPVNILFVDATGGKDTILDTAIKLLSNVP